jgi:SOS response regulatory protein OraA/RecX
VFGELDESALLEQALDRRLRRGLTLDDEGDVRRVHRYLIAQGFDPSRVHALLQSKIKNQESKISR